MIRTELNPNNTPPYLGLESNNLPGVSNLIFSPGNYFNSIQGAYKAYKIGDKEGFFQNSVRTFNTPLVFIHALLQSAWYVMEAGRYLKIFSSKVIPYLKEIAKQAPIVAIIGTACELFVEIPALLKDIFFFKRFSQIPLESIRKKYFEISSKKTEKINAYVQENLGNSPLETQQNRRQKIIDENLHRKKWKLMRRVQPWLAEKMEKELPSVLTNLQSSDPRVAEAARKKSIELSTEIKAQSTKSMIIHAVAIAAIVTVLIGLSFPLAANIHFLVPFAILVFGGGLGILRYFMHTGLLNHSGWDLDIHAGLPEFVNDFLAYVQKKWKKRNVTREMSIPLVLRLPPRNLTPPVSRFYHIRINREL